MKQNFTFINRFFATVIAILFFAEVTNAQCVAPVMTWQNASLITAANTAGQINAKYKFPGVTAGVDAIITITDIQGGATLTSIDDNTFGYSAAWQPTVHTKNNPGAGESYVAFKIDFVKSNDNTVSHQFACFALSFIDVDGDNDKVQEFVETKQFDSYQTGVGSLLQVSQNSGFTRALGPVQNYPGLDTTSYPTNVTFKFTNKNQVQEVRIGSKVANGFIPQDRYNLGYFQPIVFPLALPVKYRSFDAIANNNVVKLNWITENEINHNHFEVERSFDGSNFKTMALVLDGFSAGSGSKSYTYNDNSAELADVNIVYYRLKQVDMDGRFTYSNILAVRMQAVTAVKMQVSPNPFVENLYVRFASNESGTAQVQLLTINGQKVQTQQSVIGKGSNTIQVQGIGRLNAGIYIAQLVVNGVVVDNQKIIKN
ncbi:MAG: T9SS type A sorting domain-containing protein [Ferruginibacter sp.]